MGNVSGVPAGFFSEALLAHSAGGITEAMLAWGSLLLARGGKARGCRPVRAQG